MPKEYRSKSRTKCSPGLRKFHHLCRNQERLTRLTCHVPWPPVAARELLCLAELLFYILLSEFAHGKGPEGRLLSSWSDLEETLRLSREHPVTLARCNKETIG